jgi:2-methylcitrate dehydratase PrpD
VIHARTSFFDFSVLNDLEYPIVHPQIKSFTISHPVMVHHRECLEAMVELAKSQHEQGKPFERVVIRTEMPLTEIAERLRPAG